MKLIILCFTILFLPLSLSAGGTDFTIEGGTSATDYKYENNTCTILTSTKLTISGTTTTNNIIVKKGVTANIVLNSININLSNVDGKSAIDLKENATLNLTLAGTSTLISGKAISGIHLSDGSNLIITAESDGHSLTVTGGGNSDIYGYAGTGIGKNPQEEGNATLKIEGGNVTANGGKTTGYWGVSADGIGKNVVEGLSNLTIDISGGNIETTGENSPWLGYGGNGINGIVRIKGGSITAKGKYESIYENKAVGIAGYVTVENITITDCSFGGEVILKDGTFINCTINDIISLNEESLSFINCKLNFKEYVTLTDDYNDCTLSGNIILKGLTLNNQTLEGNIILDDGTFNNCTFSGDSFLMNKGTINNTNGSNITAKNITINDGDVTITMPDQNKNNAIGNDNCTVTITGGIINVTAQEMAVNGDPCGAGIAGTVTIKGGRVTAISNGRNGAGIGGYGSSHTGCVSNKPITISGGIIYAKGGTVGIGSGTRKNAEIITITGGTITAKGTHSAAGNPVGIGSGRDNDWSDGIIITGGSIKSTFKNEIKNDKDQDIYLAKTPEIADVTDVSVDGKPYYISENYKDDNRLYLYMTGEEHIVTVRTSGGNITTYSATYNSGGNVNDGYFTFNGGSSSIPGENSFIVFDLADYKITYGAEKLTVTLTVTEKVTKTRSAAMNSVQLTLTGGTTVLLSDRKDVTGDGDYEFVFETKELNAGSYTLTAQYGGNSESLISSKVIKSLVVEKVNPTYTTPSNLKATYGQTLAYVPLSKGWKWDEPTTLVGNAGENSFVAIFTPTKNYNTVQTNLSVKVRTAIATDPGNLEVTSSPVAYGAKLSDITITDGWMWVDENTVPTVANSGYLTYYSAGDYSNYDWSAVNGYNSITNLVERTITPTVNRADLQISDFIFTAPDDLIYNSNSKTVDVEAKPEMKGVGLITIKYYKDGILASEAKDPGTYIVKISVAEGDNYNATVDELTAPDWTFTIVKKQYNINIVSPIENGAVTADKITATEGETVILTVIPASGYELKSLSYTKNDETVIIINNNAFVMPESDVMVTATFKEKPVDPTPVYYIITLPAIKGVITNPKAGSYDVKESDDFGFILTIEDGYRENSVPVVTVDGEVIAPQVSNGKYIIPDIYKDIDIEISGIVKDQATGNMPLPSGFSISITNGVFRVTVPHTTRLYLTDTVGRLLLSRQLPAGDTYIEGFSAGAYLLTLEGQPARKILLK